MISFKNNRFFYLQIGGQKFLFKDYDKAVSGVKEEIQDASDINEDNLELCKVTIEEDGQWKIKEISWMDFALKLMKE